MPEEKIETKEQPAPPVKPQTSADRYAEFINTQDEYKSIFQTTNTGPTTDEIGIVTGKLKKGE